MLGKTQRPHSRLQEALFSLISQERPLSPTLTFISLFFAYSFNPFFPACAERITLWIGEVGGFFLKKYGNKAC
jgi:hypothetical protein